uniref:Uncharacterized protein n=1 Tax=Arundo donax TaxID=35708 RepID=A0A0A9EGW2_ARUDO
MLGGHQWRYAGFCLILNK